MKEVTVQDLNLPAYMPISETFNLEPFQESREGKSLIDTISVNEKIAKLINYATIVLTVGIMILSIVGSNKARIFTALVLGAIVYGIGSLVKYLFTSFVISPVKSRYVTKRSQFANEMAQEMLNHFGGYYYAFGTGYFFLYNPDICLYVNAENGDWLGYDKASIKKVKLSHVLLGSSTTSKTSSSGVGIAWASNVGTYQGSSTTHSESTSHYEWRFDILSEFFHYPNLTLVFPDDATGQDFAKKAEALLS